MCLILPPTQDDDGAGVNDALKDTWVSNYVNNTSGLSYKYRTVTVTAVMNKDAGRQ